jgi:hypothetical protein
MMDIRYTLEHSGDYIADVLEKAAGITGKAAGAAWSAAKSAAKKLPGISLSDISFSGGSIKGALSKTTQFTWSSTKMVSGLARGSARGVILTYDINRLKKEKRALVGSLGERFLKVYGETSRPDLSEDAAAAPILARLSEVEKTLAAFVEERSQRLYPPKREPVSESPAEAQAEEAVIPGAEAAVEESYPAEAVAEESYAAEAVLPETGHTETGAQGETKQAVGEV